MTDPDGDDRRGELERALQEAARRLLEHRDAPSLLLPLGDESWIAVGPRHGLAELLATSGSATTRTARESTTTARIPGSGIDVHDERDVKHWMELLDVTREDLVAAVGKIGTKPADIRTYFVQHRKHW